MGHPAPAPNTLSQSLLNHYPHFTLDLYNSCVLVQPHFQYTFSTRHDSRLALDFLISNWHSSMSQSIYSITMPSIS